MMSPGLSWTCGTPPDPASPVLGLQEHILGSLSSSWCSVQRVELRGWSVGTVESRILKYAYLRTNMGKLHDQK